MDKNVTFRHTLYPWNWEGKSTCRYLAERAFFSAIVAGLTLFITKPAPIDIVIMLFVAPITISIPLLVRARWCVEVSKELHDMGDLTANFGVVSFERIPGVFDVFGRREYFKTTTFQVRRFTIDEKRRMLFFRVNDQRFDICKLNPFYSIKAVKGVVRIFSDYIEDTYGNKDV